MWFIDSTVKSYCKKINGKDYLKRLLDKQGQREGTIVPLRKHLVKLEWQLAESCRDGRRTELVFRHSLHSLARGGSQVYQRGIPGKPTMGSYSCLYFLIALLCYSSQVCHLSTVRAELAYLCLWQPFLGVWSHMGWLSLAKWGFQCESRELGNKVRYGREGEGRWRAVTALLYWFLLPAGVQL